MKILTCIVAAAALCFVASQGQNARSRPGGGKVEIRRCNDATIRAFLSGWGGGSPKGTRFTCRSVGSGSSTEALVYLSDREDCGSGGCLLLVLAPRVDGGYSLLGHILTVWPPIRVLSSRTNGRNDLVAGVAGGGILPGYNAKLTYNGKSYPISGSSGTKIPSGGRLGAVVISRSVPAEVM